MKAESRSRSAITYLLILLTTTILLLPIHNDLRLVLVTIGAISLIVLDERTRLEATIEAKLQISIREFWVPITLLCGLLSTGIIQPATLIETLSGKAHIILFILSFALIAEGLADSGFVNFLAYRVAERCGGNTNRLILYLFALASILTYFTSNDIVILALTPIVISVAVQARISNPRMLLLAQFIAANTVSMGLLIGSPTNIIVGDILKINFFEYALVMAVPTVYSFMVTFLIVDTFNATIENRGEWNEVANKRRVLMTLSRTLPSSWSYRPRYPPPIFASHRTFNSRMLRWVVLFGAAVATFAINTLVNQPLYPTVLMIVLSVLTLRWYEGRTMRSDSRPFHKVVASLPWGIIPFALVFFSVALRLSESTIIQDEIIPRIREIAALASPVPSLAAIFGSGLTVNVLNDLPASALTGEIISATAFQHDIDEMQTVIGLLTGVNIGTYVTPIGALAGLIWFGQLRRESTGRRSSTEQLIEVPQRSDLMIYGALCFVMSALALAIVHYAWIGTINFLIGPAHEVTRVDSYGPWYVFLPSLAFAIVIPAAFRRRLLRHGVVLLHLADVFSVVTKVRFWIVRRRLRFVVLTATTLFMFAALALYGVESYFAETHGSSLLFDNVLGFFAWFGVFVASGFEQELFPRSLGGVIIGAVAALASIGTLVYLGRVGSDEPLRRLRSQIAYGRIPARRVLLFNLSASQLDIVRQLLNMTDTFVVCVVQPSEFERVDQFVSSNPDRGYVIDMDFQGRDALGDVRSSEESQARMLRDVSSMEELLDRLALASLDQIFLFGRELEDDLESLSIIAYLDELYRGVEATSDSAGMEAWHSRTGVEFEFPEIVVQFADAAALEIFEAETSLGLRNQMSAESSSLWFGEYLRAKFEPQIEAMDAYYELVSSSDYVLVKNQVHLDVIELPRPLDLTERWWDANELEMETILAKEDRRHELVARIREEAELPFYSTICGVHVQVGGSVERLALGWYLRDVHMGPVDSVVVANVYDHKLDVRRTTSRDERSEPSALVVVGSNAKIFDSIGRIAAEGVRRTIVICPSDCYIPDSIARSSSIEIVEVSSPTEGARRALSVAAAGGTILIFDTERESDEWIDQFLRLVVGMRFDLENRGRDRILWLASPYRRKIESKRRFYVDHVVDMGWPTASYLYVFIDVLYGRIAQSPDFAHAAMTPLGVTLAHEVAMTLRRFVVRRFADVVHVSPGLLGGASGDHLDVSAFMQQAEKVDQPAWEVVAVARLHLIGDEKGDLRNVEIEVIPRASPTGRVGVINDDDLILGIYSL